MRAANLGAVIALLAGCDRAAAEARPAASMSDADYDHWRRPAELVAALGLHAGDRVADVGAGDGYLTFRLADAVAPGGRVVATDVDRGALDRLERERRRRGADRIEVRAAERDRSGLEPGAYDLVLLAQVDHLLDDRVGYLGALAGALAPGGRIAVANRIQHRAGLEAAARAVGLRVTPSTVELPGQFLDLLTPEAP